MSKKLWFISEDDEVIRVFDDYDEANEVLFYLKEEDPFGDYKGYGRYLSELDDYQDEYELANENGYLN